MSEVRIIDLKANVLEDNEVLAAKTRERLKNENTFLLNLMSAPGSGKTTTLTRLIETLKDEMKIAVMEADKENTRSRSSICSAPYWRYVSSGC